jgi:hypothetical protein
LTVKDLSSFWSEVVRPKTRKEERSEPGNAFAYNYQPKSKVVEKGSKAKPFFQAKWYQRLIAI